MYFFLPNVCIPRPTLAGYYFLICFIDFKWLLNFEISRLVLSFSFWVSVYVVFKAGIEDLPISFFKHLLHVFGPLGLVGNSIDEYLLYLFIYFSLKSFSYSAFLSSIVYGIVILGMSTFNIEAGSLVGNFIIVGIV